MLKTLLKPFASLRLTVPLLVASMFLVFAGTMVQVTISNYDAQEQYFHSFLVWINLSTILNKAAPSRFSFPFPGGYVIGGLLLVNLLAAHSVRFKLTWKRTGIILTHLGLILLLVGEGLSSRLKVENHMSIDEGTSANYAFDQRDVELAIIDASPADHDNVTVIPLDQLKKGKTISHSSLPFQVRIDAFYDNTDITDVAHAGKGPTATAGAAAQVEVAARGIPKFTGAGDNASRVDAPSAYITPIADGQTVGTYLTSIMPLADKYPQIDQPQEFQVKGKPYSMVLRFKRTYKPYTIYLKKFRFDRYTGTEVAKNFSSDIRLVDPTTKEDRMVHLWMNHPLRYNGETFYQAGFNDQTEHGTVLQVVTNPGWTLPYISCAIGGLGLLIHFGITLVNFLNRHFASRGASSRVALTGNKTGKNKGEKSPPLPVGLVSIYDWVIPAGVAFCAFLYMISAAFPHPSNTPFDLLGFGELPVSHDGRIQPLDTTARVSLRTLRGRERITVDGTDDKGKTVERSMSAAEWLAEVIARPEKAADYKCFRIDWPDIVNRLTRVPGEKYFSPNEVFARWVEFAPQIIKASEAQRQKSITPYQQKLLSLSKQIEIYLHLGGKQTASNYRVFAIEDARLQQALGLSPDHSTLTLAELMQSERFKLLYEMDLPLVNEKEADLTPNQLTFVHLLQSAMLFENLSPRESLRFVPPQKAGDDWVSLETAAHQADKAGQPRPADIASILDIEGAYTDNQPEAFNKLVAIYEQRVEKAIPTDAAKARFEASFNAYDPFTKCMYFLYLPAFILICCSWLGWTTRLYRAAVALILIALAIHTGGLIARIYISGRPPVTNITSSAIFIAWGVVVLSLGFELIYRNSIGLLVATVAGFASLLIADKLAILHGDSMEVKVAVLDTNFWLATHVVCVTLGYAATLVAGFLGIIYILWGLFSSAMTKERAKDVARMTYGVVCFAMFFSFVGTILGGIWADQSWGRFWGWDTKENGAVLVVLMNAVVLHSRWGGLVRERGVAVLVVLGNIVVAWSWFGTNELGIGLHSYGFTEGVKESIWAFVASQSVIVCLGLIPLRIWASAKNWNNIAAIPRPTPLAKV